MRRIRDRAGCLINPSRLPVHDYPTRLAARIEMLEKRDSAANKQRAALLAQASADFMSLVTQ